MDEAFRRRRLPHWDRPGATYFVTSCLAGSIPARGELQLQLLRAALEATPPPAGVTPAEWPIRKGRQIFAAMEVWLDRSPAVRHLERPPLAEIVENALQHFDRERYELIAWVVMPSHLHWVFRPLPEWVGSLEATDARSPRERIVHSVNSYTATHCNRLLHRNGTFWQHESYDHVVRDEAELERIVAYVHANPVRAGLAERPTDYPFSSARHHE